MNGAEAMMTYSVMEVENPIEIQVKIGPAKPRKRNSFGLFISEITDMSYFKNIH